MKKLLFSLILVLATSMAATRAAEEVMQIHRATLGWAGATDDWDNYYTVEFYMDIYVVYSSSNGTMTPLRFEYLGGAHSQIINGGPLLGDYLLVNNPYITDNGTIAHIDWEWDFRRMGYYGTGSDSKKFYLWEFQFDPSLPSEPAPGL